MYIQIANELSLELLIHWHKNYIILLTKEAIKNHIFASLL